ncbi:hypothetical protein [Kaistella polysaccharea]|uniref:hypothetical protein n=1 Tax=Kaistella polysaccharea TaxID=2878534 RepID=UPI001CF0D676|nr:hypothetical protein [Kaistella polysaccharea]
MKQENRKTSRERTDIFYNSSNKNLKWNSRKIAFTVIAILVVLFLLYQFGYFVGETAYKDGL